jgi:hypothetical protein
MHNSSNGWGFIKKSNTSYERLHVRTATARCVRQAHACTFQTQNAQMCARLGMCGFNMAQSHRMAIA